MKKRVPQRRVVRVAELVPLDANRRRVRSDGQRAVRLEGAGVHRIRLCWRVSGEVNQRSRLYPRADVAAAQLARAELVAALHEALPVDADGWPIDPVDIDSGPPVTFADLLRLYVDAHPDWTPKHRGNVESVGGILADLLTYPPGDPRGAPGEPIALSDLTTADCERAIAARRHQRRRGSPKQPGGAAISARTEDLTWKLAVAVLDYGRDRTPPVLTGNPMRGAGRRKPTREIRSRAEEEDTAWSIEEIDLVARAIHPHFAALVQLRGRSALRPSEAAFVEPGDIDLEGRAVELRGSFHLEESPAHNGGSRFRVGPLKWREPGERRTAPLPDHPPLLDPLRAAIEGAGELNARRRADLEARLTAAHERGDTEAIARTEDALAEVEVVRVFRNPDGSPIDWTAFNRDYWHPALEVAFADAPGDDAPTRARKARRRATHWYDLRHMAEAIWIDLFDVPLEVVSLWAGTSVETLQKHYRRRRSSVDATAWRLVTGGDPASPLPSEVADLAVERQKRRPG